MTMFNLFLPRDAARFALIPLIGVFAFSLPAFAAEAKPVDAKVLQERFKSVTELTEVERERLRRNIAEFDKLSEADKEKYRELHREIQEDKSLAVLLQTYSAWLQTLTPSQREELRKATDSSQKLALVRKFKDEQYHPLEHLQIQMPDGKPSGPRPGGPVKPLSGTDLNSLMKVLVAELPDDQKERFAHAKQSSEYLKILHSAISLAADGPKSWPSRELQDKLIANLRDERLRNFIKSHKPNERDDVLGMICSSIWVHALEEVRSKWPAEAALKEVQEKLSPEEKAKLEHFNTEKRRFELARHFFEERHDNTWKELRKIRNDIDQLIGQLNLTRPKDGFMPGPGPGRRGEPGGGPPGRGGPPGGGPPGGGPRDDRPPPPKQRD